MSPAEAFKDETRPYMYSYGKHMGPGKELVKLDIVYLKVFLPNYDYRLVEGQVCLRPCLCIVLAREVFEYDKYRFEVLALTRIWTSR